MSDDPHNYPSEQSEAVSHGAILHAVLDLGKQLSALDTRMANMEASAERAESDREEMKERLKPIEADRALATALRAAALRSGGVLGALIAAALALSQLFDWLLKFKGGGGS